MFRFLSNRVTIGMLLFMVAVGLWEFRFKPQYRPYYERAVVHYQDQRYDDALLELEAAYEIAPNAVDVMILMGWINLKMNRFSEAQFYFDRALRFDPTLEEANIGSSFIALETGRGRIDLELLERYLGRRGGAPDIRILIAEGLVRQGDHFQAARIYGELSDDRDYGLAARTALTELYGLPAFTRDVPLAFAPVEIADELRVRFQADRDGIWRRHEGGDRVLFAMDGVGLSPAVPGHFPSKPPLDYHFYEITIRYAAELGPRVLLLPTLMPPAFYRALKDSPASSSLALLQQVRFDTPPEGDMFEPAFIEEVRTEIRAVVDALHGHGEVAPTAARAGGVYEVDHTPALAGFLFGRELEPSVAVRNNLVNGGRTSYRGKYVSVELGNPTEVWYAEMLDYLVDYQASTYGAQTPVSVVNWPPLDPFFHETEATTADEIRFRLLRGESVSLPEETADDNDVTSIDESRFKVSEEFRAGYFATYNIHPYWPDFLTREETYLTAADAQGPGPFLGYLRQLRERIPYPLVVGSYGLPNSIGVGRRHPQGWNQGGLTELEQALYLRRMTEDIRAAGASGGIVESLFDEWYKASWLTRTFESSEDRSTLWLNDLEPQGRLGLVGFETGNWRLCEPSAWGDERAVYSAGPASGGRGVGPRMLRASADEGYLYLKLDLPAGSLDRPLADDGQSIVYAVALNTRPGQAGYRRLPFPAAPLAEGANFIVLLAEGSSRLLVADSYYPFHRAQNEAELVLKRPFTSRLAESGTFGDFEVQTNRQSFSRSGSVYPPQRENWSVLRESTGGGAVAPCESEVIFDHAGSSIVLRLPWAKLIIGDPSSSLAFAGIEEGQRATFAPTEGIAVAVYALAVDPQDPTLAGAVVVAAMPEGAASGAADVAHITWSLWDAVNPVAYTKQSYWAIQRLFAESTADTQESAGQTTEPPAPLAEPSEPEPESAARRPPVRFSVYRDASSQTDRQR